MKVERSEPAFGPSSSLGIMRFFDSSSGGPKLSPELVFAISAALGLVILILQKL
ncbi:MAG: preprotein translocase subunit Sec61beta [Candidatus Diapherotrites archaeon]|uniref:Preprotein translocase subunit Sec61beta n=1 Tax=Candidatus Iainarchaeum sp. TaxID=3101447 RepID=A0A7J4KZY0_9ARCH|nr:preprotein translocase subunit Sec61beta [Candidatus Diapherotrites archaeon]HIH21537.1 preprotein translocase subunit Sec61beta [Candidatus Diapherotrites archaeon]HIH32906.1 preprotein translocase subunit Sec61beta [Candidatus Diapherotrites archaeon]